MVLSLVNTGQTKLSSLELVLGGAANGIFAPAKFPATPRPGHDINAAAEHRMDLTVRHLTAIGGSWLARTLHLDLVHHLQRHWGKKLTAFITDLSSKPEP